MTELSNATTKTSVSTQTEIGIVLQMADGTIASCNTAAAALLGMTIDQLQDASSTSHPWQAIHPDGSPFPGDTHPAMVALQTNQPHTNVEMGFYKPSGELVWFKLDAYPLFQRGHDRAYAVTITITPITPVAASVSPNPDSESDRSPQPEGAEDFRQTFDLLSIGLAHVNLDGKFRSVNPKFCEILGYTELEILNLKAHITHPEDIGIDVIHTRQLLAGELDNCSYEKRYIHKLGHIVWTNVTVTLRTNTAGEPLYFIASIEQIDDRKQAQLQLRESEERLKLTIEAAKLGVFDWNIITQEITWNDDHRLLLGYPLDCPASYPAWEQRVHPDDLPRVIAAIELARQTQADYTCEYRVVWADGTLRWLEAYGRFYYDRQHQPMRMTGIIDDISDRKHIELALQTSEQILASGIQVASVGLGRFDYSTNSVTLSARAAAMFGFGNEEIEVTRERIHATFHPDESAELMAIIARVIDPAGEGWFERDHRVVHPNGEVRWLGVRKQVFFERSGAVHRPTHAILAAIDITDRKQTEAELEQKIQETQAARETAERANRLKEEFLAVLSHELRSPLNPILGWSKLLKTGRIKADKVRDAAATIERNAQLQSQLIEDLLDISRILQGKLVLDSQPVNLEFVITAACETVRLAAEAKQIDISTKLAPGIGQILGDAARLQQVVWNLMSNAIKFTTDGGSVGVSLTRIGNKVQIQVVDTGKGISPEFLPYVFERFRQEDGSNTRKFGGLGLGLAIVRQLVELHGGSILVESDGEGRGATFTVCLPLLAVRTETNQEPIELESDAASADLVLADYRILVVDDDADSREFISFILEQSGASVTAVDSAMAALKCLARTQFSALVSDIGMPEINGYRLMQQVRSLPAGRNGDIRAIALTAYAGEVNAQQALQAGFEEHLAKPIDPDVLIASVTKLCARSLISHQ